MFSPNKKPARRSADEAENKPMTASVKKRMWTTVALTFVLLAIWFGCIAFAYASHNSALLYGVMIAYFVVFAALLITYLAYNRGFVNKNVTEDMLPADWSREKKQAFLEGNRTRAEKSRWMVTVIIPFVIVFLAESLYLFVWDGVLSNFFKGL